MVEPARPMLFSMNRMLISFIDPSTLARQERADAGQPGRGAEAPEEGKKAWRGRGGAGRRPRAMREDSVVVPRAYRRHLPRSARRSNRISAARLDSSRGPPWDIFQDWRGHARRSRLRIAPS